MSKDMNHDGFIYECGALNLPRGGTKVPFSYEYSAEYPDVIFLKEENGYSVIQVPITSDVGVDVKMLHKEKLMSLQEHPENHVIVNDPTMEEVALYSSMYKNKRPAIGWTADDDQLIIQDDNDFPIICNRKKITETVFGASINYLYIEQFPDVVFPVHEDSIIGYIVLDSSLNMAEMDEDARHTAQKEKYMAYALDFSPERDKMLMTDTIDIAQAITTHSNIFANRKLDDNVGDGLCAKRNVIITDIENHIYAKEIQAVVDAGIFNVDEEGRYKPDISVTRGQLAVVLSRTFRLIKK